MNKTTVVNIHHKQPYDIYIGRSGRGLRGMWGNPYTIGRDGTRAEVIEKYRAYILGRPDLLERLPELAGKRLGCFCKPQSCHGDVLVELIERNEFPEAR